MVLTKATEGVMGAMCAANRRVLKIVGDGKKFLNKLWARDVFWLVACFDIQAGSPSLRERKAQTRLYGPYQGRQTICAGKEIAAHKSWCCEEEKTKQELSAKIKY